MQVAGVQANIEKTQSETLKNVAQARAAGAPQDGSDQQIKAAEVMLKAEELKTDQFRAVTERMSAQQPPAV
jgi:hypothetical protein